MEAISEERLTLLKELEEKIHYSFKKKYILNSALTHSSYANQWGLSYVEHNERQEFLGDSVLGLIVSEYIFKKYRNKPEGKLTKIRASIVCEASLFKHAKKLNLGDYLLMGKGEEVTGGRERISILADAYEALIAAIYIDGGLENARKFVLQELEESIKKMVAKAGASDYKSRLQEQVQKEPGMNIRYEIIDESGPAHNRIFHAKVSINNKDAGYGSGRSKKEAEQEAARSALISLGDKYE